MIQVWGMIEILFLNLQSSSLLRFNDKKLKELK